jgi:hypothetical protein
MNGTLVFVYNAESGLFNALSDIAHKIFSPQTYACNLCALTHSNLGMRQEWKEFIETLEVPAEFLHADELKQVYKIEDVPLPAIFRRAEGRLELLIESTAINSCQSMSDLKRLIRDELTGLRLSSA